MDIFGTMWENHFEQIVEDWQNKVSDDDIVLLAGDLSWAMTFENALIDVNEIEKLKGKKSNNPRQSRLLVAKLY